MIALLLLAYAAYELSMLGYTAYRLFLANLSGSLVFLIWPLIWPLALLIGGIGVAMRKWWSQYLVYLVTLSVLLGWLYDLWQGWRVGPQANGLLPFWMGLISAIVLLFSSTCIFLYFRGHADVVPRPPRWWIGVYVFAGVWLVLLPVFGATAHHFGPGFFPLMASVVLAPVFTVVLSADFVLRITDAAQAGEARISRRRWALLVSGGLLVAYAFVSFFL